MVDFEEESLDVDNLGQEPEGESPEEGEPHQERSGNLNVALREEREKRRQIERERDEMKELLQKREAMLSAIQPQNNQPQVDRSKVRQQLQVDMFERPDEVLYHHNAQVVQHLDQRYAPMFAQQAKLMVGMDPNYKDVYAVPSIKQAIDAYIDGAYAQGRMIQPQELNQVVNYFGKIREDLVGNKTATSSASNKPTSTVNKGASGSQSAEITGNSDLDVWNKALKMSPKDYAKWEKDPKNRPLLERVMKQTRI